MRRATEAQDRWIPPAFQLEDGYNCLTNSEKLADMNLQLRWTVGFARLKDDKEWGDHAWCVAPDRTIVDPYFRFQFPEEWRAIIYRESVRAFNCEFKDYIQTRIRDEQRRRVTGICKSCSSRVPVRPRSFWTTGMRIRLCAKCEQLFPLNTGVLAA